MWAQREGGNCDNPASVSALMSGPQFYSTDLEKLGQLYLEWSSCHRMKKVVAMGL